MQYGSSGTGAGAHICALLLDQAMGVKITHVPYRGSGPAMQDLLAGRIDYICEQISTAVQQIKAGTVKPIATMGLSRSDVLPDLRDRRRSRASTSNCASLSAFEFPEGTPEAIVQRLAEATNKAVESAFVRERFETLGVAVEPPERRTREYYLKACRPRSNGRPGDEGERLAPRRNRKVGSRRRRPAGLRRIERGLRPPPPRAGKAAGDRDQPILRTQPSVSAISPRWMPTSLAFSAAVIGPPVPSPITMSPLVLLILPIAETTAAVPQAKASRSLPLAASARHCSML